MRYLAFFALLLLTSCAVADRPSSPTAGGAVFDVPALLGQDIDQVRSSLLGKTQGRADDPNARQYQSGPTEWTKIFARDTTTLLVSFNSQTRQVHDFFIRTAHGATADYTPLLQLANVRDNNRRVRIEPLKTQSSPVLYSGVRFSAK
ncbi:hypothetical protein Q5H93_21465 [Hymenobacter sp. ASUV-10]|uniref:Uncharacterized protein n=1 Tax=Hymenobacter aranciens TaxID=3063996 RepID=A0ABT9BI25_9BACT|nr:hypothetical protein [Hymenobacter sp. ASUV-10]MDO7877328.1 hypothetical protein [Hymenobacter sp. ASUV-10]